MTQKHHCKICGEYSGKMKTCKSCKEKYPFQTRGKGANPFNRLNEYNKRR